MFWRRWVPIRNRCYVKSCSVLNKKDEQRVKTNDPQSFIILLLIGGDELGRI